MPNPKPAPPHLSLPPEGASSLHPSGPPNAAPPASGIVPRGPFGEAVQLPPAAALPEDLYAATSDGAQSAPAERTPEGAVGITLVIEREGGRDAHRTVPLTGDRCRIGSHPSSDVVLADPAISRMHCELTRDGDVWRLRDASSSSGTTLDSVRVRDAEVRARSTIELGTSTIRVYFGPAPQPTAPTAPAASAVQAYEAHTFGALVGASAPMRALFELLEKISESDINVLIEGESGTGKELVASEVVRRSARAAKPFVIVDCGAISAGLVESELFGHTRGAFTGAERDRVGAFEAADGGTVFLDEIGELPLELQPKLLRALEAREVRRVGESKVRRVDVRVLSATNRGLEREIERGRFREDLYFRLAVIRARVPSLRERKEDIPLLIQSFLAHLGASNDYRLFPANVLAELALHDWPGNVRELRNHVERTIVLRSSNIASTTEEAPPSNGAVVPFRVAKDGVIEAFERAYLARLLEAAGGNMSRAARMAGMDRMYLHRLTHKHGLRKGRSES